MSLVEEAESHVIVLLLRLFLLFLLLLLGRGSTTGAGANAGSDGSDEVLDVARGQSLGEEAGPERLDGHLGGLQDGGDLLAGDVDVIVGQDEGGVDAGEFGGVAHGVNGWFGSRMNVQVADIGP